jgi:hypothetical protein
MLLGQNLSRPCNFSASPSLREAHSQPTSCLGLLQPITVGLAIGPVAIAAGSTSSRSRPPRRPCDMSTPPRARLPCQPYAAPRRPHQPRGPSPPPPSRTRLPPGVRSGEPKENFPNRRPNPIQGESISIGFK